MRRGKRGQGRGVRTIFQSLEPCEIRCFHPVLPSQRDRFSRGRFGRGGHAWRREKHGGRSSFSRSEPQLRHASRCHSAVDGRKRTHGSQRPLRSLRSLAAIPIRRNRRVGVTAGLSSSAQSCIIGAVNLLKIRCERRGAFGRAANTAGQASSGTRAAVLESLY